MVAGRPRNTRVPFYVRAKNKREEGLRWDFKSTCALGRPNPGGPREQLWGTRIKLWGFFPPQSYLTMPSPHIIEFNPPS